MPRRLARIGLICIFALAGGNSAFRDLAAFEKLLRAGKMRYWVVSNFDLTGMQELTGSDRRTSSGERSHVQRCFGSAKFCRNTPHAAARLQHASAACGGLRRVTPLGDCLCYYFLGATIRVHLGGVNQRHTELNTQPKRGNFILSPTCILPHSPCALA
jgi:hypothetical protein